ncbi:MAG: DUF5615 family PIN-like protein [Tepidisphaeraceae bacterium]
MKLLLDENLPHRLRHHLPGHDVSTVRYMGWSGVSNGNLLRLAADAGFDVLLTQDKGMQYQQNATTLPCGVLIFKAVSNEMDDIEPLLPEILDALATFQLRTVVTVPAD